MAARKPPLPEHQGDGPETPFAFLLSCADAETKERLRKVLADDQERLFLLLRRTLNPVEHLTNEDEATLRGGIGRHKIGELKAAGKLPEEPV